MVLWNVLVTSSWIIQPQVLKAPEASARNHQCRVHVGVGVHWLRLPEGRAGGCPSAPSCPPQGANCPRAPEPQNVVSRRSKGAQLRGRGLEGLEMGDAPPVLWIPDEAKGSPQSPGEGAQVIKEQVLQGLLGTVEQTLKQVSSP